MASETTNKIPTIDCECGRRHQAYWVTMAGVQHGCRYAAAMATERWQHSAAGIAELAGNARDEGIARWNAAQIATPGGSRQARHLAEAAKAFAQAYELEN